MTLDTTKRICQSCVGDLHLRSLMKDGGYCFACSSDSAKTMELVELAERVKRAVAQFYSELGSGATGHICDAVQEQDSYQNLIAEYPEIAFVGFGNVGRSLIEIIRVDVGVNVEVACEILKFMMMLSCDSQADTIFAADSSCRYLRREFDGQGWHDIWGEVQDELRSKARFFSKKASQVFGAVFGDIASYGTTDGRPIIRKLEPGFELFRARVFQDDARLKTALEYPSKFLGPPPLNASGGRMNAHGISVFYGATSAEVALTEVRPPVGSKVAIAKFVLQRELNVLDLTALDKLGENISIFDSSSISRADRAAFLRTFCRKIVMPVMPDHEASEYLITQAAAEYLAFDDDLKLDGIIYPSAQIAESEAVNIVIFNKSARAIGACDPKFNVKMEQWGDVTVIALESLPAGQVERGENDCDQILKLDDEALMVATVTGVSFRFNSRRPRRVN